jgi:hypothetical protein
MEKLTPEIVQRLWAHMAWRYGAKVVQKSTASEMKIIGRLLSLVSPISYQQFMAGYVTTVKNKIYVPFKIGTDTQQWSLWDQVFICAHEFGHVHQWHVDGYAFWLRYLFSSAKRAGYEAEANKATFDVYFDQMHEMPNIQKVAQSLAYYGCTDLDISVTLKSYRMVCAILASGGTLTKIGRYVIRFLHENGVK